jgi:sulfotransferase famil protein
MKAAEMRAHIDPAVWRSYFKFAFERNPRDRQVSLYYHRYREESDRPDFATFIHKDKKAHINNFGVYSIDGNLAVDFLGRFETLEQDLRSAREQVGLSTAEALPDAKTRQRPLSGVWGHEGPNRIRKLIIPLVCVTLLQLWSTRLCTGI